MRGAKPTHGHYVGKKASRTYRIWRNMRNRCERDYHSAYPYYGGRGISVCERWKVFANFLEDMGAAPDGLTLDRIDGNGNYEKSNCRWASKNAQANNTKSNRTVTFNGETHTVAEWADKIGIKASRIYSRLDLGHDPEKALSTMDLRR